MMPRLMAGARIFLLSGLAVCTAAPMVLAEGDIKAFIRKDYAYGLSCVEAKSFGPTAIPVLGAMLNDPADEPYWQNIVLAMGCIGDPAAVSHLQSFLDGQKDKGKMSFDGFAAVQNVPTALAILAQQGHPEALDALRPLGEQAYWEQAKFAVFEGVGEVAVGEETVEASLKRSTAAALELTGDQE